MTERGSVASGGTVRTFQAGMLWGWGMLPAATTWKEVRWAAHKGSGESSQAWPLRGGPEEAEPPSCKSPFSLRWPRCCLS